MAFLTFIEYKYIFVTSVIYTNTPGDTVEINVSTQLQPLEME